VIRRHATERARTYGRFPTGLPAHPIEHAPACGTSLPEQDATAADREVEPPVEPAGAETDERPDT